MAALMAALTFLGTKIFQFPTPIGGYIHLGDGFVLLSGIILGPVYGGLAAGIGSMLCDLLSGYAQYAGATFVIKALAAIGGGAIYTFFIRKSISRTFSVISAGVLGGIIVTLGYFLFESFLYSSALTAAVNIPANLVQNAFGILVSSLLMPFLAQSPFVRDMLGQRQTKA